MVLAAAIAGCAARGPLLAPEAAPERSRTVELESTPFFPQTAYQCGPAALATVLGASGVAVTPEALEPRVYLPGRRGSLQAELVAAARTHDRIPYVLPPGTDAVLAEVDAGRPVLILQNLGLPVRPIWHYAVVVGYDLDRDRVLLRSGTERRRILRSGRFLGTWNRADRWALVMLAPGELPAEPDAQRYREAVAGFETTRGADAALPAWEAGARTWPDDAVAWVGMANGLHATGRLEAAQRALETALALAPHDPVVRHNLAHVLSERGCHRAAREQLHIALEVLPATHPLHAQLAAAAQRIESAVALGSTTGTTADSGMACPGA